MCHLISQVVQVRGLCDQLQVANAHADRNVELVCVDNTGKRDPVPQSMRSLAQKVGILREEHTPESDSTIEQVGIGKRRRAVLGCCQDIYLSDAQPGGDRT